MATSHIIGRGGFGSVTAEGDIARKQLKKLRHTIQELIMTKCMRNSKYIVNIESYNTMNFTICTERWSCSLREAIIKYDFNENQKMRIFRDVLCGLSHLHQAGFLHADVTLSNILIDKKTHHACLCDLGLSSLKNYSKIWQTAKGYSPENPIFTHGHDMFGFAVCMTDLFGEIKIYKEVDAKNLRNIIQKNRKIPKNIKDVLIEMCPDNPVDSITSSNVLEKIFKHEITFSIPKVIFHKNTLDENITKYLSNQMKTISINYNVKRSKKCYLCILHYFNSKTGSKINPEYYDLYMITSLFIFSSLYSFSRSKEKPPVRLTENECMNLLNKKYNKNDFHGALNVLIADSNYITMSVFSKK